MSRDSEASHGTHHQQYKAGTNVVFLDPDVARVFRDSDHLPPDRAA
jgi:hypothetical protein